MKRKRISFLGYYQILGLIAAFTLLIMSCSSTSTSAPDLSSITIKASLPDSFTVGSTLQFTAIGTYLGGSTADITSQVTWISSNPNIVTITSTGIATGKAAGSANISAVLSGLTSMPITLPVLAFSYITPTIPPTTTSTTPTMPP